MASQRPPRGPHRWSLLRLWRVVLGVLLLLLLGYLAVLSYHFAQIQLGPFAPLAATLVLAALLAVLGPLLLVRFHRALLDALARGMRGLGALLAATGLPQRFAHRFPRFTRFLIARFSPGSPVGLALSAWVIIAALLVEQVIELSLEVTSGRLVPALDRRIENLVATMRTAELDHLFYAVTWLGSLEIVAGLAVAGVLLALLARRPREALLLVLVTAGSWLSAEGLKYPFARHRPSLADARILDTSFSFPSGHATLSAAFYGTAAYFLIRGLRRDSARIVVGIVAAIIVLLVGVSRAYLGVHFPSDVLAGWVLGFLWLALIVIADHLWQARLGTAAKPVAGSSDASLAPSATAAPARVIRGVVSAVIWLLIVAYAGAYVGIADNTLPTQPQSSAVAPAVIPVAGVTQTVTQQLPHYTEGLTGVRQEPISLVFVGTRAQIEAAFRAAGWTEAERFSFQAITTGATAAITHGSAPAGPVTPSFLAEEPNVLAFSLPVGTTFAERHHIRLWATTVQTSAGQTSAGQPLWLATASFDTGFELAPSTGLPTHQIDPNIDAERSFVVTSLQGGGLVQRAQTIQLVPPEAGINFDGDPFHTDGQTIVLYLAG